MDYEKKVISQLDEIIDLISTINAELKDHRLEEQRKWEEKHDEQTENEIDTIIEQELEKEVENG